MNKYIVISDISKYPCYKNINARLLYLHIACNVDTSTYNYCQSVRRLAMELDMSVDAVRHAIKQLTRDGLITTQVAPHLATQYAPQSTPQPTTHLHIVTIKDLGTPNGTPNTTPYTTPNTTPNTTDNTTVDNIINKKRPPEKEKFSLTRACEEFSNKACGEALMKYCSVDTERALALMRAWVRNMTIKKRKEWDSKEDAWQHLLDWSNKHRNDKSL